MKRTYREYIRLHDQYRQSVVGEKITCEVTGEMENGTKVWTKIDDSGNLLLDEQYYCGRMFGNYFFVHA